MWLPLEHPARSRASTTRSDLTSRLTSADHIRFHRAGFRPGFAHRTPVGMRRTCASLLAALSALSGVAMRISVIARSRSSWRYSPRFLTRIVSPTASPCPAALTPCVQIGVSASQEGPDLVSGLSVSDHHVPLMTGANGTLMARRS
jgi:hypothetical protein